DGQSQGDAFPRPVAMSQQCDVKHEHSAADCHYRRNTEKAQSGANGDELGNQGEEISNREIDDGKPSPEGPEAGKNQLSMAAMSSRSDANRHLLDDYSHGKSKDDEWKKESHPEAGAGGGVGDHAGTVVFAEHHQNARAYQEPQ